MHPVSAPSFSEALRSATLHAGSPLCIGLDPDPDRLPSTLAHLPLHEALGVFLRDVIEATAPFAAAFKPNFAFYERFGVKGWMLLADVIGHCRTLAPHAVIVGDGKRGDIGNTSRFYAQSAFEELGVDAVTISPYMGSDSVAPFLEREDKGAFVLAHTSNVGARDFQQRTTEGGPLYELVVKRSLSWADRLPGTLGFVAGATDVKSLARIRDLAPDNPLLIPGIGAQGGSIQDVLDVAGPGPMLINVSRGILYAGKGADFAKRAAEAADAYGQEMAV